MVLYEGSVIFVDSPRFNSAWSAIYKMIGELVKMFTRILNYQIYLPDGSFLMTFGNFFLACCIFGLILKFIHWLAGVNNGML